MEKIPLVTLSQLKSKYRFIKPNRYTFLPIYPSPELAEFIGMLLSDGILNKWGTVAFVNSNEHLIGNWKELLNQLFYKKSKVRPLTGFKHKKPDFVVRITSTAIAKVLKEIGLPHGRRSEQLFNVPEFIRNPKKYNVLNEECLQIQRIFLRAIFSCDGTKPLINKGKEGYRIWIRLGFNKDERLRDNCIEFLNEIKEMLNNFDIKTTKIYHYPPRRDFFFSITKKASILKFYNEIGYNIEYKQRELEKIKEFIKNFKTVHQKRLETILEFLSKPRSTLEIKNMIGLHFSKAYLNLVKLQKQGLIDRIRENNKSIWIRR